MAAYDIFISYRRDGGETMALLLHDRLSQRGYRVFLDVESLNAGSFNNKLLDIIDNCKDVLVILSENSLERCANDEDWVRKEIAHAFKAEKNIIPFMLRGFKWPDSLPFDIADLPMQNGINAISNEYFDASIERLCDKFLVSQPNTCESLDAKKIVKPISKIIIVFIISITVIVVVALIVAFFLIRELPDLVDFEILREMMKEAGFIDPQ